MKTTEEIIKDSLLGQSHKEFERTLRSAVNLKQVLDDEESTSKIIMQLLGKKEKKPVTYDEEMDFIDAGAEEVAPPPVHRRGNPVHHATELADRYERECRMESGTGGGGEKGERGYRQQYNVTADEDEQIANTVRCDTLRATERILGPASGPMFTSLATDPVGSDLLQRNQLSATNYGLMAGALKQQELGTLPEKKEEKPAVETKQQQQRKGKKKKEKGLENEYTVKANEFSQRSLSEILLELGETVSVEPKGAAGKNKNKKKSGAAAENKEQNKNNKKKNQGTSSSNNNNNTAKMESNSEEENANLTNTAAPVQTKRSSSGVNGSWEDAEEEFMSADEDIGGSNSRLTTPPTEFVDARSTREEGLNDVMLDPSNYRDDEEVELLAKQLKDQEDEFITVGKNNKKNKQQKNGATGGGVSGRSGSDERARNSPQNGQARRFSATSGSTTNGGERRNSNNNRPVQQSTTLADYIDVSKKDTHKNVKYHHKKPFNNLKQSEESVGFVDALESASPINVNTNPPVSGFSYADATKKPSSGENSPQNEMRSPAIQSESMSSSASSPPNVQLPPGYVQSDAANVSFGYIEPKKEQPQRVDEHELEEAEEQPSGGQDGNDFVLKFGSRVVRFAKGHADNSQTEKKSDPQTNALIKVLQDNWTNFMSGTPPVIYQPKAQSSSS